MKSAQDGKRPDHTGSLNRARYGRILTEGQVRPRLVIVASVRLQNPAQMRLAQDNGVSKNSRRIDPISRSTTPFCQGEAGAIGLSRMPMARSRRVTIAP
jgi:hypothetical protein